MSGIKINDVYYNSIDEYEKDCEQNKKLHIKELVNNTKRLTVERVKFEYIDFYDFTEFVVYPEQFQTYDDYIAYVYNSHTALIEIMKKYNDKITDIVHYDTALMSLINEVLTLYITPDTFTKQDENTIEYVFDANDIEKRNNILLRMTIDISKIANEIVAYMTVTNNWRG